MAAMSVEAASPDERTILAACAAKDFDGAASAGLRTCGADIFGLLVALHSNREAADDAFSLFADRLWRTLRAFRWDCPFRSWAYRLARTASADVRRQAERRQRRQARGSTTAAFEQLKQQARTETIYVPPTAKRTQLEKLREELAEDERMLLILRVDRELPWREVARVMSDLEDNADEQALALETARLRKRFQLIKERLRRFGKDRGLL